MLRSSYDACGCSTQTTSTINLKRSTLHPHEGQADRPNTPSDSVNHGSNPGPSAMHLPDMTPAAPTAPSRETLVGSGYSPISRLAKFRFIVVYKVDRLTPVARRF